ncbi:MAG: MATE family efflux transporter [Cellulosilyticaceae bacterium]
MKLELKKDFIQIALPITIQSLFQASMGVVDQVMAGQLGEISVAGIGLGGKFASLYSVIIAAVATAAGILISQFVGNKDEKGIARNFWMSLGVAGILGILFSALCICLPWQIMRIYSTDSETIFEAARYLGIIAIGFMPMAVTMVLTTLHRSIGHAKIPLYASVVSACINTALNYFLIFGNLGFPKMGVAGAAWATTIARFVELFIAITFTIYLIQCGKLVLPLEIRKSKLGKNINRKLNYKVFSSVLLPILLCEALWSMGENVYAAIYGRMGTAECAAMTLTSPIQSLMIGAMTGVAAASGIIVGKKLGEGNEDEAYHAGKQFMGYGLIGTIFFAILLYLLKGYYIQLFRVEDEVKNMTLQILTAYAVIIVVKVENMILGGGVIRSGGKTKIVLIIDAIGTWCVGIPLGLLAAFVWKLPIGIVYFILSLEECVRLLISLGVFKKRIWMQNLAIKNSEIKNNKMKNLNINIK